MLDKLREQYEQQSLPSTPQGQKNVDVWEEQWPTPLTIRTLKRQGKILRDYKTSPSTCRRLNTFIKGSIAQALTGAQAKEDLSYQQAAQNARRRRATATKTHVQKGGVLSAKHAREITQKRQIDELANAARVIEAARKREQARLDRIWTRLGKKLKVKGSPIDEWALQWAEARVGRALICKEILQVAGHVSLRRISDLVVNEEEWEEAQIDPSLLGY